MIPIVTMNRKIGMKIVYQRGGEALQKVYVRQYAPREGSSLQQDMPPRQVDYSQII